MKTDDGKHGEVTCGRCGAANGRSVRVCWLCRGEIDAGSPFASTHRSQYNARAAWQIGLGSVMATITLLAVLLGVFRIAPGLGVLLAIVVVPAWIRTTIMVGFRHNGRREMTTGERFALFANSVGATIGVLVIMMAVLISSLAALCGLIIASNPSPGALVGVFIAFVVFLVAGAVMVLGFLAVRAVLRRKI